MQNLSLKKRLLVLFSLYVFSPSYSQEFLSKFIKLQELGGVEEYLYEPNGMNILLIQDNSAPVVTVQIVYHVGSKHEVSGNTGSTHLLEHLNFKGTPTFNKRNGNAIFNVLQSVGAQMNATTWCDRTNYYETIPSDKIELALEIEADRMRNSLLLEEDKAAEMTVVRNEFERGENNPNKLLSKEIWATAYMAHPYHHNTIGWRSDIEKMPIEVLRKFYNTYYWPDNATLTIIGDFQKENLFNYIDTYFGKITKAPHDIPQPYTEEPEQYGPRKVIVKKPGGQGVLLVGYKIPGRMHKDLPALTVLGEILGSGTSSLLNKTFVDTGKSFYIYSGPSNFKEAGLFSIGMGYSPESNHEDLNKELIETIENIKKEGFKQEDVDRVVAKLNAQTILSRDGSGSIAGQINEAIAGGDWTDYINGSERLTKVTAQDVKRVANLYLVEDQSTTGYFIPSDNGSNQNNLESPVNYSNKELGKYYYRHPDCDTHNDNLNKEEEASNSNTSKKIMIKKNENDKSILIENNYIRKTVANIDVITAKTGAKDFVSVSASFSIGSYFNTNGNEMVPSLTAQMLSKGTTKNDKFQFSQQLEKLGVYLNVSAQGQDVSINFKCLKNDLSTVIALLSEELRFPLFDENEFQILKQRITGNMKQNQSNPSSMGSISLNQSIYPKNHPNYATSIDVTIDNINSATIKELMDFHSSYIGPADMHLVAVGDIDAEILYRALENSFSNWSGGVKGKENYTEPVKEKSITNIVSIPEKPSAELYIGQYTGIKRTDKDFIPFYIATSILGGGFSSRLMSTVRDEDGLTYNIMSNHTGHDYTGGHWVVNASFSPTLFEKGLNATMVQIEKWVKNGVTEQELANKKTNIIGSYKVGLATTGSLADTILSFVERGMDPSYIQQFPEEVMAVTLEQVNNAIKKYIDLNKLITIKSGSLNQNGAPLK